MPANHNIRNLVKKTCEDLYKNEFYRQIGEKYVGGNAVFIKIILDYE